MFYTDPEHEPFLFEAGSSRALLIHGFLGSPRELRPLAQELAAAGVTARGMLLPGFGAGIARLKTVLQTQLVASKPDEPEQGDETDSDEPDENVPTGGETTPGETTGTQETLTTPTTTETSTETTETTTPTTTGP